jgi:hypothetical protein
MFQYVTIQGFPGDYQGPRSYHWHIGREPHRHRHITHTHITMSDYFKAHIKWLENRLATEEMDAETRYQVETALYLSRGY